MHKTTAIVYLLLSWCRYYEPLAQERSNLQELLHGPAVRKLLFMTDPERVESLLKPHWMTALQGQAAELLQAVPNMLEIVPSGVNKWAGLQVGEDKSRWQTSARTVSVVRRSNKLQAVNAYVQEDWQTQGQLDN